MLLTALGSTWSVVKGPSWERQDVGEGGEGSGGVLGGIHYQTQMTLDQSVDSKADHLVRLLI